ncbi:DUF262 domain-containing protein [Geobacillus subterraneus]|nr:DUF262 domain-containing protein [Geobacillus subterraneus]
MNRAGNINFQLTIQRKEGIWDKKRKSLFIHSLLTNCPIPPIYATKEARTYHIIDGKQRLTTVFSFIENEFALDEETPAVQETSIKGKRFQDLPDDLQQQLLSFAFDVIRLEEITTAELEQLFYRLNQGVPLRKIETTRAILGGQVLRFVEEIANTPFFQEKVNLSKAARKRFVDQEVVLQILMLLHRRDTGFSSKEMEAFVKELKAKELQEELKTKIQNVCYYLNEAFPVKKKFLKKLHIPMIFLLALENQENDRIIPPKAFGEWAETFFSNLPSDYFAASQSGSARKENVQTRIQSMRRHHHAYFADRKKIKLLPSQEKQAADA